MFQKGDQQYGGADAPLDLNREAKFRDVSSFLKDVVLGNEDILVNITN